MAEILRFRKKLAGALPRPTMPPGVSLLPVAEAEPASLHALLFAAYTNDFGSVPPLEEWWPQTVNDEEFDSAFLFILGDADGNPVALALCWNSGFIKDLVVAEAWRGRGLGEALLLTVFATFAERGFDHVDLKVMAANAPAIRLYRRVGMEEMPL